MSIISCDITPEVVYFWDKECGFIRFYSISFSFIRFHAVESYPQLILNDPIFFKHCGCNCFIVCHLIYPMISFTPWSISPSKCFHPQSILWTPRKYNDHMMGKSLKDLRLGRWGYGSDVYRTHFESSSSFYNIFVNIKQETWVYKY